MAGGRVTAPHPPGKRGQRRTWARQPLVTIRSRSRKKRRTSSTPGPVPFTRSALHDRTPITTRRTDSTEVAEREARVTGAGRDLDVGGDHPDPLLVRVMVTGSAGLVGHAVRRRLEAAGVGVVPVDRDRWSFDGVEQVECDLLDPAAVERVVAAERPTVVVRAGGVSGPMVAADDPARVVEVNVAGTAAVLEAVRRHGVSRVVFCSSIAAYGSTAARQVAEERPRCTRRTSTRPRRLPGSSSSRPTGTATRSPPRRCAWSRCSARAGRPTA